MHGNLSLRDSFSPTDYTDYTDFPFFWFAFLLCKNRSMDLHRFYRCAMGFLDVLGELGRCAALDFVIWCFSHGYLFSHGIHGIFYSRTRCLTSSNALDGTHGNAVAAPACHSELVSPTNFTNFYCCAIVFISHRLHRLHGFSLFLIRSFAAQKSLYGFAQIFSVLRPSGRDRKSVV